MDPAAALGVDDDWEAYCVTEALMIREGQAIRDAQKPDEAEATIAAHQQRMQEARGLNV